MGYNTLFFNKNIIFFEFLFVLSKDSLIFAQEKNDLNHLYSLLKQQNYEQDRIN